MRVLVACEFSGVVRRAFRERGHDAWSCDLLPAEDNSPHHLQMDALEAARSGVPERVVNGFRFYGDRYSAFVPWDLLIAHPPCTHLAVSGARWFHEKEREQKDALRFVFELMMLDIDQICIENPVSIISTWLRRKSQVIQPHQFGHPEFKATCLWLKNLPLLRPTNPLPVPKKGTDEWKAWNKVHRMPPGPDRWKERSRTFEGIAAAMADQWGNLDAMKDAA